MITSFCKKILGLVALLVATTASAVVGPTALPTDTRLVVFTYDPHNSYEILARPRAVTNIEFKGDEHITYLALGDTIQWEVAKTASGQHLFLKPKAEKIWTSATIVTDKRTYQVLLKSTTAEGKWYQRVTWEYPDLGVFEEVQAADKAKLETEENERVQKQFLSPGTAVESINFNYEIEGDAKFKPVTVMDDGKSTFFRMPPKIQEFPAIFMINDDGDSELMNYTVRNDYLIVPRLLDRVLLKIGKAEVRIVNRQRYTKSSFFGLFGSR